MKPPSGDPTGGFRGQGPALARALSLAFEFAGAVAIFWFIGRLVDDWLGTAPWAQVVGAILGWVGGVAHVYYKTKELE